MTDAAPQVTTSSIVSASAPEGTGLVTFAMMPPSPPELVASDARGRRSVGQNVRSLIASQLITWPLALIYSVAVPRYLGPTDSGQLRLATSLWVIAAVVCAFGTSTLVTLEFAKDRRRGGQLVGRVLLMELVLYLVLWPVVLAFAWSAGYTRRTTEIIALVGASSVFSIMGETFRAALYGLEQMQKVAFADIVVKVVSVATLIGLLILGVDVRVLAAVGIILAGINAGLLGRALRSMPDIHFRLARNHLRSTLKSASTFFVLDATLIAYMQIDIVIMSLMLSDASIGYVSAAASITGTLLFIPTILMTSTFPAIARLNAEDPAGLVAIMRRTFLLLVATGVPIGLGTVAVADPFAVLIFGRAYEKAGPVLAIMGIVVALMYPTILIGRVAVVVGKQWLWAQMTIVALVATVPLDILFIRWMEQTYHNGAIGGALSYAVTEAGLLAVGIWKVAPNLLNRDLVGRIVRIILAGLLMGALVWPLRERFFLVPVVLGAISYVALIAILRPLGTEDYAQFRRLLVRSGRSPRPETAS